MDRDQMNQWRCKSCGAGPESYRWTEWMKVEYRWNGQRFEVHSENPNDVRYYCAQCGQEAPDPHPDLVDEAIN
jgi:hypothetical protein